jgi:uncharacterized protein (UPF0335 family)
MSGKSLAEGRLWGPLTEVAAKVCGILVATCTVGGALYTFAVAPIVTRVERIEAQAPQIERDRSDILQRLTAVETRLGAMETVVRETRELSRQIYAQSGRR